MYESIIKAQVAELQKQGYAFFVKKRSGEIVNFDGMKIFNAIMKAFQSTNEATEKIQDIVKNITVSVINEISTHSIDIEQIQDIVERKLMENKYYKTAKAYILYREKRAENRDLSQTLSKTTSIIDDYLHLKDWRVNENSNMSYSLQGLNFHIATTVVANYWLNKIYTPNIAKAHRDGLIHIHDLGALSSYCVGWDLEDLLIRGFGGVAGKIECRPPKHFRTALGQIVNFFYTLQGEAAGAQAFSNFDTLLAPFIRYDNLSYKEVKQAMQEFIYNLNVPTRVGFQTPFTNITFDLVPPPSLADKCIIIGGEIKDETYKEFQPEIDMINQSFAEIMLEGDAKGRPFGFPIPTYNISKRVDLFDEKYTTIWQMTSKYGTPYFSNFINSNLNEDDVRSMCCRLRLNNQEIHTQRGGIFSANPLTGSIGVITINLPRIAFTSKNEKDFFANLKATMHLAKEALEIKRKVIEELTERNLFPYTKIYLEGVKERTGSYWANHFATIGIVGMNETILNLKKIPYHSPEGLEFAEKILDFMLNEVANIKNETNNLYNLEASPAEGASYRLAKIDKNLFPEILTAGTNDTPYYTNSIHLPVNTEIDIFEMLDFQNHLQPKFTGGTVVHVFLGEANAHHKSIAALVKKIAYTYKIPYFSITPTFSVCPVHGYLSGEHFYCPLEHSEHDLKKYGILVENADVKIPAEVYSRVVGYYRPVQYWNLGKKQEFKERKTYRIS